MLQIINMITLTNQINHRPLDLVFAFGSRIRPTNTNGFILGLFPLQIYTSVNVDYRCWLMNKVLCKENTTTTKRRRGIKGNLFSTQRIDCKMPVLANPADFIKLNKAYQAVIVKKKTKATKFRTLGILTPLLSQNI